MTDDNSTNAYAAQPDTSPEPAERVERGPEPVALSVFHDGHGNIFEPIDHEQCTRVADVRIEDGDAFAYRFNHWDALVAQRDALEREQETDAELLTGALAEVDRLRCLLASAEARLEEQQGGSRGDKS